MGKLKDKWNKNNFSIYTSEEKTTLRLIENVNNFVGDEIIKEVDNKTDLNGDHKGSWQGVPFPTISEEGLRGTVELHDTEINTLKSEESKKALIIDGLNVGFKNDGVSDNFNAFNSFKSNYGKNAILRLKEGTYFFSGNRPNLNGVLIEGDNITFKGDFSPRLSDMSLLSNVKFINSNGEEYIKPKNRDIITPLLNVAIPLTIKGAKEKYKKLDFTTWNNNILSLTDGNTSQIGTGTKQPTMITWGNAFTTNPQFIKPSSYKNASCYELNVISNASSNRYGFIIKTTTNLIMIFNDVNSPLWTIATFKIASPLVELSRITKTFNNGGAYGLAPQTLLNIGIYYKDSNNISCLVADNPVFNYTGEYGEVIDVGFYLSQGTNTNTFFFGSPIEIENYNLNPHKEMNILLCGDSIMNGAWNTLKNEDILKVMLTNNYGFGHVNVENKSVDGIDSTTLKNAINDYSLTKYDYVVILIGTNDQQGNTDTNVYATNIKAIGDSIKNGGAIPVFIIPPIYTTSTVTGIGVTTSNYNKHSAYTQTLKNTCIENGYLLANGRRRIQDNLSFLNDNLHVNENGMIGIFTEVAKVIGDNI